MTNQPNPTSPHPRADVGERREGPEADTSGFAGYSMNPTLVATRLTSWIWVGEEGIRAFWGGSEGRGRGSPFLPLFQQHFAAQGPPSPPAPPGTCLSARNPKQRWRSRALHHHLPSLPSTGDVAVSRSAGACRRTAGGAAR